MNKNLHVIFRGRVQGVGFRYTAEALARDGNIKGWVRNLGSGEVEISAEAEERDLKTYLERLEDRFSGYISDTAADWQPATDAFKTFEIRF
ncbi:MAG: acylphosphatase [Candidatus Omnitrophota bacterium]